MPAPLPTGIVILDKPLKSTGTPNWNCLWMGSIGALYRKDALVVLRAHPRVYLRQLKTNIRNYFLPADRGWPFDGTTHPNREKLSGPLDAYHVLTTGTASPGEPPWLSYAWLHLPERMNELSYGVIRLFDATRAGV